MGYVRVNIRIGSPDGKVTREVDSFADTGAFYTTIPPRLAYELGLSRSPGRN
jgi:predicted aspartyl protease